MQHIDKIWSGRQRQEKSLKVEIHVKITNGQCSLCTQKLTKKVIKLNTIIRHVQQLEYK